MKKSSLTAIVPCFNEEENVEFFYKEFRKNDSFFDEHGIDYELIYVDDGSDDSTAERVRTLAQCDPRVRLIAFSRNFGKEAAMLAGMKYANGDYVSIMDADLQDPPSLLPEMFGYIEDGYDQVATRRKTRKGEPKIRSWFARRFYHLINSFSKTEIVDGSRDFRLMKRNVVDAILQVTEYNRFSKGIFSWVGFRTKWIEYDNIERQHGKTKWNFWSLFGYAIDGIVAYSTVPLTVSAVLGVLLFLISIIMIVFIIVRKLAFGDPTQGWASLVCIILMMAGLQLFCSGITGEYLAKAYLEVKKDRFISLEKIQVRKMKGTAAGNER